MIDVRYVRLAWRANRVTHRNLYITSGSKLGCVQNMDISYMYHPIYIRHFGSREKVRAPAVCLRIIFSDYGSGAIGCNPDYLRDCESDRNG